MNHIYRLIWNHRLNAFVAVAENAKGRGKSGGKAATVASAVAGAILSLSTLHALAADNIPIAGDVIVNSSLNVGTEVSGNGNFTISPTGNVFNTTATSSNGNILLNSSVTGSVINRGTIGVGGAQATVGVVVDGGSLTGSFINEGTISAINAPLKVINGSSIGGDITNSGTITGQGYWSLYVGNSTVAGSILNSGVIGGGAGRSIAIENSTVTNGITNTGTLQHSLTVDGAVIGSVGSSTNILNTGSIGGDLSVHSFASQASSSAPTVTVQSVVHGSVINNGVIDGYLDVRESTVRGSVINTGVIGHSLTVSDSTVTGRIDNSGTLGKLGVKSGAVVQQGVTNSGLIQGSTTGVSLKNGTINGALINTGRIITSSTDAESPGIFIGSNTTITAGFTNSGTIEAPGTAAIGVYKGSSAVNIINLATGSISGATGIYLGGDHDFYAGSGDVAPTASSTLTGSIVNHGRIEGSTGSGISFDGAILTGGIVNHPGATISGAQHGIAIEGRNWTLFSGSSSSTSASSLSSGSLASHVQGGITNSGLIQGASGSGIDVGVASTVTGGIQNLVGGVISGVDGIKLNGAAGLNNFALLDNGIVNAGHITGSSGAGILVDYASVTGGISNQAGGTISGAYGIALSANGSLLGGIVNAELISGTIKSIDLRNVGNAISIDNTGTLQGDVYLGNAGNILNLNGSSSRVIGNVANSVASSTVNVNGAFTSEGTFNIGYFNVNSGGLFNMHHGITSTTTTVNSGGTLNVGTTAQSITGNYAQNVGGVYNMGLTGTSPGNYGVLNVTGTAGVAGGINVVISGSPSITSGTIVSGVIRSSGMTATPADIIVTDNNLFYNFTAASVSNPGFDLDLIVAADSTVLTNAVAPTNPAARGVAQSLQQILIAGASAGYQPVFNALATMNSQQLNDAFLQLTPSLQGAAAQAGVNALHSMNKIIQSRVESVQGLNSGDKTADKYAWTRVFGNWGDQNNHKGVPGYENQTKGLAFGMDKPITDRIRAGLLATYAQSDLKSNFGNDKVDVDTYEIAGYASYNIDPHTDVNVQLDLGLNKAKSARHITFMGTTAKGDFDSYNYHMSGGIGHLFQLSERSNLTPSMRLDYTHVKTAGYTESGAGVLNLRVDGSTYEELILSADTKLSHKLNEEGLKLVGNFSVGYDFMNKDTQSTSTFVGGGPAFITTGLEVSPWIYRGGIGLIKETGSGMELSARYDIEGRTSGYLNQTASVKVRWSF